MKDKKLILSLIIALALIAIILIILIRVNSKDVSKENVSSQSNITNEERKEQEELEELKDMGEISRMQFYVSKYISYLEDGSYEKAYNLLYDDFKKNYFKTESEFEKYIKDKYPNIITLEYDDIQRLGTYYVLTVKFYDLINDEKNFTQLFVVRENGFNDFVLSFQAQ